MTVYKICFYRWPIVEVISFEYAQILLALRGVNTVFLCACPRTILKKIILHKRRDLEDTCNFVRIKSIIGENDNGE